MRQEENFANEIRRMFSPCFATENQTNANANPVPKNRFFFLLGIRATAREQYESPRGSLGPEQWFLKHVGDLVDHLQITWAHHFLATYSISWNSFVW